jgi:predicted secreted protein
MTMPTAQARARAAEVFGQIAAADIMRHRAQLIGLTTSRDKALEDWRQKGSEREAAMTKSAEERQRQMLNVFVDGIKGFQSDYPELFGEDSADKEGNELLRQGHVITKLAFLADGLPDGLTPEQRQDAIITAQTQVATRAAAYGRERLRVQRLQKENATLRDKLKQYENSEPVPDTPAAQGQRAEKDLSPEDLIDRLPGMRL